MPWLGRQCVLPKVQMEGELVRFGDFLLTPQEAGDLAAALLEAPQRYATQRSERELRDESVRKWLEANPDSSLHMAAKHFAASDDKGRSLTSWRRFVQAAVEVK